MIQEVDATAVASRASQARDFEEEHKPSKFQKILERLNTIDERLKVIEERKQPMVKTPVDKNVSYDNRKNTYLNKLNNAEILYPKQTTLEYYGIKKVGDRYE